MWINGGEAGGQRSTLLVSPFDIARPQYSSHRKQMGSPSLVFTLAWGANMVTDILTQAVLNSQCCGASTARAPAREPLRALLQSCFSLAHVARQLRGLQRRCWAGRSVPPTLDRTRPVSPRQFCTEPAGGWTGVGRSFVNRFLVSNTAI
jgi:hypothetical protein